MVSAFEKAVATHRWWLRFLTDDPSYPQPSNTSAMGEYYTGRITFHPEHWDAVREALNLKEAHELKDLVDDSGFTGYDFDLWLDGTVSVTEFEARYGMTSIANALETELIPHKWDTDAHHDMGGTASIYLGLGGHVWLCAVDMEPVISIDPTDRELAALHAYKHARRAWDAWVADTLASNAAQAL